MGQLVLLCNRYAHAKIYSLRDKLFWFKMKRSHQDSVDQACLELEEEAVAQACTLNIGVCRSLGIEEEFLAEWSLGVPLTGQESTPRFVLDDYPAYRQHAVAAAEEFDRLAAAGKILWYPSWMVPRDL